MIASIEGKLIKLDSDCCLVQVGAVGYEVMLASYCVNALSGEVGSDITLCTMEYYEGTPGRGNLIPRMVGFLNTSERDFFTKYISVKGVGIKKSITGNGRASKEQVQKTIQTILSLPQIPEPNDVADAIAAAMCCANSINSVVI